MGKKTDLKDTCASCKVINCIDLFRHTKNDNEFTGGELYVYKQLTHTKVINEELTRYICSNGRLLQCACFIVGSAYEEYSNHYLTNICIEIVRDMKSSFYLAMSGHYRQAILLQRCVFENFLYGLYFHAEDYVFSKSEDDQKIVQKNFKAWLNGKSPRKSTGYLLDIITKGGLISKEEKTEWHKLFNQLSKFVHTILHTPTGQAIKYGNVEISGCAAVVEFDKNSLTEWSGYYQTLLFLVLHKLLILYPSVKKKDAGKLALKFIKAEFKEFKGELKNPYLIELLKMRAGKLVAKA